MSGLVRYRGVAYRLVAVAVAAVLLVKGVLVYVSDSRGHPRDYVRWHKVAQRALHGEPLADVPGQPESADDASLYYYRYPPAFAFYIAPLGLLPYHVFIGVWYLLSAAAAIGSVLVACRMVFGRWLPEHPLGLILPMVGVAGFMMDDLHCGNVNLLILLLVVLGVWLAGRRRELGGGLAIGAAISLKAFPAAMLAVLLLARRWKLAGFSLLATVLWSLLVPGVARGFARQSRETAAWYSRIVKPYAAGTRHRTWAYQGLSAKNQSAWSVVQRLTRPIDARTGRLDTPSDRALHVNVASLPSRAGDWIFIGIVTAAAAAFAVSGVRVTGPRGLLAGHAELSAAAAFILLASPIAWTYYFALLLPAMAVGTRRMLDEDRRGRKWMIAVWAISAVLILGGLFTWARAVGTLFLLALVWYGVMLVLRTERDSGKPGIEGTA